MRLEENPEPDVSSPSYCCAGETIDVNTRRAHKQALPMKILGVIDVIRRNNGFLIFVSRIVPFTTVAISQTGIFFNRNCCIV